MSGSLTPLPHGITPLQDLRDLPGVLPAPMPAFHTRKEVQIMLRRWRNGLELWGRILAAPSHGSRDACQRYLLPNHTLYIK
ncbi:hypothetical protein ACX80N_14225 [Arthrobacter sp. MDT2-16]